MEIVKTKETGQVDRNILIHCYVTSYFIYTSDYANNIFQYIVKFIIPYNGAFLRGAKFYECCTFGLSKNFHDLKIHDLSTFYG